ncbi:hypothetical protein QGX12_gp052 [Pseudomonas phage Kremar]|uniref:Uncharacterized protein n=1 Tax=Pseudomonas phage Kremar TaxID=2928831 RepID=A0AAE9KGI6_9CAUD|nr:hypothetical protein QGX12_gp052 [Pseudomonas phage Kremar]UOL48592.1 hypothetical protein [Pseudomonas phage Kremar]
MEAQAVESIKKGEFVKRKENAKGVFVRGDYDQSSKRYSLVDTEDHCREVWVKKGTMLFVGFDY